MVAMQLVRNTGETGDIYIELLMNLILKMESLFNALPVWQCNLKKALLTVTWLKNLPTVGVRSRL